jgi:3-dehydroquinate dehydratase/shikimate dehydrogenase
VTADNLPAALKEIDEAAACGAEVVELRLDFLKDLDLLSPGPTLKTLLDACKAVQLPAIVTFRPAWEG